MAEMFRIICPACGYNKDMTESQVPKGALRANCPKCRQSFALNNDTLTSSPSAVDAATVSQTSPPVSTPRTSPPPPRELCFNFSGSARDYFGIWIINTLLKLLTLGIYSAWAKVRKRRFFYGSTTLDGQTFDYLADPMALFKGWLIAAAAFLLYALGSRVSPLLSMAVGLMMYAAFPWLLVRSRMFNANNSSHRNIRFGFRPDYSQAYLVYAAFPLLTLSTLGFLIPYTLYRQRKFMIENSTYGDTPFVFTATAKDFYMISLKIFLAVIGLMVPVAVMVAGLGGGAAKAAASAGSWMTKGMAVIPLISFLLIYFIIIVYAQTALSNLCWNSTSLAGCRFQSSLRIRDMAVLFVTNSLAILFSLGLLMPWATVRLMRYRFDRLTLLADADLDAIIAAKNAPRVNAAGEEIGDVFGISMDIAI